MGREAEVASGEMAPVTLRPIGVVRTDAMSVPRHWTVSDVEGSLIIDAAYQDGLKDVRPGQDIVVIFHFHKSRGFSPADLRQQPPHRSRRMGVFSICSPFRPNPVGLSVLTVTAVLGNTIRVRGLDMIDGTPILDIKPHVVGEQTCPSRAQEGPR